MANGDDGAGVPSGTDGLTCPWPVPYSTITDPLAAGLDALFRVLSWLYAAAPPVPFWLTANNPGAAAATSRLPPAISSPVSAVRTATRCVPTGVFAGTWKFPWPGLTN